LDESDEKHAQAKSNDEDRSLNVLQRDRRTLDLTPKKLDALFPFLIRSGVFGCAYRVGPAV
jgi:hypothetical protein